jgi:hypothetical protein
MFSLFVARFVTPVAAYFLRTPRDREYGDGLSCGAIRGWFALPCAIAG